MHISVLSLVMRTGDDMNAVWVPQTVELLMHGFGISDPHQLHVS
jgi:hypothetical protein